MKRSVINLGISSLLPIVLLASPSLGATYRPASIPKQSFSATIQPKPSNSVPSVQPSQSTHPQEASKEPMIEDFSFHRNQLGDPAGDVIDRSISNESERQECYSKVKTSGEGLCMDFEPHWIPGFEYGVKYIDYEFYDGILSGIDMAFKTSGFETVREMMVGKYGQPNKTETVPVMTKGGVTYDNTVVTWRTKNGPLILKQYGEDIMTGEMSIRDHALAEKRRQADEAQNMQRGREAF